MPQTLGGRPSTTAAPSTSPSASCARAIVEDQRSPSPRSARTMTSKSWEAPSSRSVSTLPEFFQPNRVSSPTITAPAWRASTKTCSTNSSGVRRANSTVNSMTSTASRPDPASSSSRCASEVSGVGARSGKSTASGCGSKVTATEVASRDVACSTSCPRHRPVPAVHPVEVAEGDDGTTEVGGDLREAVPDVHGGHSRRRPVARTLGLARAGVPRPPRPVEQPGVCG